MWNLRGKLMAVVGSMLLMTCVGHGWAAPPTGMPATIDVTPPSGHGYALMSTLTWDDVRGGYFAYIGSGTDGGAMSWSTQMLYTFTGTIGGTYGVDVAIGDDTTFTDPSTWETTPMGVTPVWEVASPSGPEAAWATVYDPSGWGVSDFPLPSQVPEPAAGLILLACLPGLFFNRRWKAASGGIR